MPKSCSFGLCPNNGGNSTYRFFTFPTTEKDPERRKLWTMRCGRKTVDGRLWEPNPNTKYVFVCSAHFITGDPWNNKSHPDYAPHLQNNTDTTSEEYIKAADALRRFTSNLKRQGGSFSSHVPGAKAKKGEPAHHGAVTSGLVSYSSSPVPVALRDVEIAESYDAKTSATIPVPVATHEVEIANTDDSLVASTSESHRFSSIGDLRTLLLDCNIDLGQFFYVKNNTEVTFVKISNCQNPAVELSVVITDTFDAVVNVRGKQFNVEHLLVKLPVKFDTAHSIALLLSTLLSSVVCLGVINSALVSMVKQSNSFLLGAVIDSGGAVHSVKCYLLSLKGHICPSCAALHRRMFMRNRRQTAKMSNADWTRSKCPNVYLSSPLKFVKLAQLARKRSSLSREITSLKIKLSRYEMNSKALIANHGVQLNSADSDAMQQLINDCKGAAVTDFEENSFQRIFFEQQLKYNSLKNKSSMRWHPTLIRWCLYVKSKSAKAYDGMRAYLNLPSNRTLFDYSNYIGNGLGLNPKAVEQLIASAKKLWCYTDEHRSFVGILFDEVKIKADLIYNKTTGELIGYVNLDQVTNEMQKCSDTAAKRGGQLAEYLLVIMVRGITTSLRYPLAAYATKSASASSLYGIIWECVECLEVSAGLKVLFICCDGAVQNRKYFKLHGKDDEITHKTKNLYAIDRDIYFISDPPHLLKTVRNCLANSFAHSKSRFLWFNQDISWTSLTQLYNDHCEKTEYRLCPKLTRGHIELTSFSKMRVSLAAQVLSSTVANALEHVFGENVRSIVNLIRIMNKWFDIMNVKNLLEARNTRNPDVQPFTDVNDSRLLWLECDFLRYFDDWKQAVESRSGPITQKQRQQMQISHQTVCGLNMTSRSVAAIVRILLQSGAPFVMTNHLNQDPLEQLFGHCRHKGGSNDNPSVAEACHAINTIRTVNTQAVAIARGNTKACRKVLDFSKVPKRLSKKK